MSMSETEAQQLFWNSIVGKVITNAVMASGRVSWETLENMHFPEEIYKPSPKLTNLIDEYLKRDAQAKFDTTGKLLEQIAFLTFHSLLGANEIESYQSYGSQLDLVVSGVNSPLAVWGFLMSYIGLEKTSILVLEAKDRNKPLKNADFLRLCTIVNGQFSNQCELGIFFTRNGAAGFPSRRSKRRKLSLSECRADQIFFHARFKKYIVVFDKYDIASLKANGSLVKLLRQKVLEVVKVRGLPESLDVDTKPINLPEHLAQCLADDN